MPRPRIDGFDERLIAGFIERGLYKSQKDVISAAVRLLAEHQMELDAKSAQAFTDDTYAQQLENEESEHAAVGHLARKTALR